MRRDVRAVRCPIFFASLPLVRKWFQNKRVTELSFTARIEGPPFHRGASASKKGTRSLPAPFFSILPEGYAFNATSTSST